MHKPILPTLLLILLMPPYVMYGQPCNVDSGQTIAFTLAAGAKASWNKNASAVQRSIRSEKEKGISFSVHHNATGAIIFDIEGFSKVVHLKISLFTVDGRCFKTSELHSAARGMFIRKLPAGMYLACCEANGTVVQTIRFIAGRQP